MMLSVSELKLKSAILLGKEMEEIQKGILSGNKLIKKLHMGKAKKYHNQNEELLAFIRTQEGA